MTDYFRVDGPKIRHLTLLRPMHFEVIGCAKGTVHAQNDNVHLTRRSDGVVISRDGVDGVDIVGNANIAGTRETYERTPKPSVAEPDKGAPAATEVPAGSRPLRRIPDTPAAERVSEPVPLQSGTRRKTGRKDPSGPSGGGLPRK